MIPEPKLKLSPYIEIYNLVVPKDNILRRINELVDFSFVYDEHINNNGRGAIDLSACSNTYC